MSILDLIGGPDYYLAYLCQRFHMQNILIGDDKADRMATEISEQTPVNIYYTNRRCVTIRQSNYSKSKAMQFSVIQAARVLTTKINATEKHNLHENVKQWRIEEKELEDLINGRKRRKAEVDEERQAIDDNVRDINARIQFVMNLLEKRATVWKDLNQVQTERENLDYVDVRFNAAEKYNIHENVKKWRQEETRLEAIINGRQWRMQLEDERSTTSKYNVRDYSACIQHRMNVLERLGSVRKEIQMLQLEEKNLDNLELNDDVAVLDIRMKLLHVTEFVAHDLVKAQWNAYKPIVLRKKIRLLNARMEHLQNQLDEMQGDVRQFEAKVSVLQLQVEQAAKEAETNKKGVVQVSNLHEPPPEVAAGELNDEAVEKESLQANTQLGFCMETDPKVVREYQEKMREIADLTKQKDVGEKKLAEVKEDIVTKKQAWLNPLQELIGTVNKNFGRYFTSMGCSGVVQLQKADDENDFAKYGIKILVKFRTSEPLSELGGTTGGNLQSGGERYISTALYILALQQVTPAPFRFIDEINQGMDVTNEARFFTVLCSLANEPSSPQCFVLTSKMIPPLDYPDNVDFHIIFSGPHVNVPLAIHSNADSSEDEGKED
ncbi:unnamed protein product [Orchesella dallaii]|uniref:Structural maintenance of chromosomes protein 5 n=1 Tax=Orchesella dallaii TaxID=48710 RepID=A0ABP1PWT3_9HEXA